MTLLVVKQLCWGHLDSQLLLSHDDVIKWKHFPRYWPCVRGIHRSPVNFPHKGQWRGASMFSLIFAWTNNWANNGDAGDLRRHRAHHDVIVMRIGVDNQADACVYVTEVLMDGCLLQCISLVLLECLFYPIDLISSLQWRHDERDGISNHQPHGRLFHRLHVLLRRRWKKTPKLRVTGLCEGNSTVTGEFPAEMASNADFFPFDDVIMMVSYSGVLNSRTYRN